MAKIGPEPNLTAHACIDIYIYIHAGVLRCRCLFCIGAFPAIVNFGSILQSQAFFAFFWATCGHFFFGNLGAQIPKMATRGRWDCRTESAGGTLFRFGVFLFYTTKIGVSEKTPKWAQPKKSEFFLASQSQSPHKKQDTRSRTQKRRKRKKK